MTTHANLMLDFEWPSGRSCPAGIALQAGSKSINNLSGFLALFLLEGAHTTLRGSNLEGVQSPQTSGILDASAVLKRDRKALSTANTARAGKYNLHISVCWLIDAKRHPLAWER